MKRNQSIELLKLLSAFFIVIIHSPFTSYFGFAMNAVARFAVPVFFMIIGYFIVQYNNTTVKLKKQIIKLTKYYILYEFVYIAYSFVVALLGNNLQGFKEGFITNIKYILISPTIGGHLWYVINIIWALIIIYIFNYFHKLKVLFISSIILHIIGILISNLSIQLFDRILPIYITRNFIFFGLFYVMVGMYVRTVDVSKIKYNKSIILVFSIFMSLCQVIEKYLWKTLFNSSFEDYFVTTIIASIAIFIFTLKSNVNNRMSDKISSYPMAIYFLHILIIRILDLISYHIFHIDINMIRDTLIENVIFIVIVCVFSCILYDISKKILSSFLRSKWITLLPIKGSGLE